MIGIIIVNIFFFCMGMIVRDIQIRTSIQRAGSKYIDPIAFAGDSISYIRSLSVLEDDELRDVISNI